VVNLIYCFQAVTMEGIILSCMPTQPKQRIVIVGGGFAGVYTFKSLHNFFHNDDRVELILVSQRNYFIFTPLLHEVATGAQAPENIVEPLPQLIACCNTDFVEADLQRVNTQARKVETVLGDIPYDYLLLALGSTTNFFNIPGASEYCFTLKSLENAVNLKNHFIDVFEEASSLKDESELAALLRFVVIGGGPTGVELAAEMSDFFFGTLAKLYRRYHLEKVIKIDVCQRGDSLLPQFSEHLRRKSEQALRHKGVNVLLKTGIKEVGKNFVITHNGERIDAHTIIWTAGVKPIEVPFDSEVARHDSGRILVDPTLQLPQHPGIFAIGDMAHSEHGGRPLPALAQVAVRQAHSAARNIYRLIEHKKPCRFRYYHKGDLISLGSWLAVAEVYWFHSLGHFAWWMWRTIYLFKIISWRKRIKVAVEWTLNIFANRDVSKVEVNNNRRG